MFVMSRRMWVKSTEKGRKIPRAFYCPGLGRFFFLNFVRGLKGARSNKGYGMCLVYKGASYIRGDLLPKIVSERSKKFFNGKKMRFLSVKH